MPNNQKVLNHNHISDNIDTDSDLAFWDEFYKNRKRPFEVQEFEDGTRLTIEIPLQKIKTN